MTTSRRQPYPIGDVEHGQVVQIDRGRSQASFGPHTFVDHNLNPLYPKYAVIDHAGSGDNTIVPAIPGKKIRVVAAFIVSAGTVTARFESGASGVALTGQMTLAVNTGFALPFNPAGWFETEVGKLLNLELSDAVSADGSLTYFEVDV